MAQLTADQFQSMINDPNAFSPLYGGSLDAENARLAGLQQINDYVSSNPTGLPSQFTPDVISAIQQQAQSYLGAQQGDLNALTAAQTLNNVPQMTGGWTANEYGMDAANKALGVSPGLYTINNYKILDKVLGSGSADKWRQMYDATVSKWNDQIPLQRQQAQAGLQNAQLADVNSFVAPSAMAGLQGNVLNAQLNAYKNQGMQNTATDVMAQAWAAKRGTTEAANRLGFLGGGGRRQFNRGVDNTAAGAINDASNSYNSDVANRMSAFAQSMEQARQQTANLEADVKNRGYAQLADSSTQNQIDAFGRSLNTATSDALSGAQAELSKKLQSDSLYSGLVSSGAQGAGALLGGI